MKNEMLISVTIDAETINACALMMAASDPWITLRMDYAKCLIAFDGPCKEIYEVKYQGELAAFFILQVAGSFKGYIQTICVKEAYRGKGFGKEILRFCEQRILQVSPNIFICVSGFNTGAIRLYKSFGFKLVGELTDFVKEGFTELLLRKSFGPILGYNHKIENNQDEK